MCLVVGLEQLRKLSVGSNSFIHLKEVELKDIPNLESVNSEAMFDSVQQLSVDNVAFFEGSSRLKTIQAWSEWNEVPRLIRELIINVSWKGSWNAMPSLDFSDFIFLHEIRVCDGNLQRVTEIKAKDMEYLETIDIGSNCSQWMLMYGSLCLENCERLKSIRIGNSSCVYWQEIVVKKCGAERIEIGDGCFVNCRKMVFEELSQLKEIRIGNGSLLGYNTKDCELVMKGCSFWLES